VSVVRSMKTKVFMMLASQRSQLICQSVRLRKEVR